MAESGQTVTKKNTTNGQVVDQFSANNPSLTPNSYQQTQEAKNRLVDESRIPGFQENPSMQNGSLRPDLKLGSYDPRGLQQLRSDALRAPGTQSAWGGMALQQQKLGEQNQLGQSAQQNASGLASARSQLASTGGLRGGAATRMAMQGANQGALGTQNIRGQGAQDRLSLSMQDEQNRRQDLSGLAGQEAAYQAPDKFNIGNTLQQNAAGQQNKMGYELGKYGLTNEALSKLISGKAAEDAASQGK